MSNEFALRSLDSRRKANAASADTPQDAPVIDFGHPRHPQQNFSIAKSC